MVAFIGQTARHVSLASFAPPPVSPLNKVGADRRDIETPRDTPRGFSRSPLPSLPFIITALSPPRPSFNHPPQPQPGPEKVQTPQPAPKYAASPILNGLTSVRVNALGRSKAHGGVLDLPCPQNFFGALHRPFACRARAGRGRGKNNRSNTWVCRVAFAETFRLLQKII